VSSPPQPWPATTDAGEAGSAANERQAAEQILAAYRNRLATAPVRQAIGDWDVESANRVQDLVSQAGVQAGRRIVGRKIGISSQAVQQQLDVDHPVTGVLFEDMHFRSGDRLPAQRLLQPRTEAEIAFVLATDLDAANLDADQVSAAIRCAHGAIEITDSRIRNWDIRATDTVADNASSGLFVLGDTALSLDEFDPRTEHVTFARNDEVMSEGAGYASLGGPIDAVLWLAVTARELGRPLRAGEIILTGALVPMIAVKPGHHITATFSTLGTVTAHLSGA
jgi:2-keto-4-pentenoate hydratase